MQVLDGFKGITAGLDQMVSGFNPLITTMDAENIDLVNKLLASGVTSAQIKHLVDVSVVELDKHLAIRVEAIKMMAEEAKQAKPAA